MDRWFIRIGCVVLVVSLFGLLLASDLFQMVFWQWVPQGLIFRTSEHAFIRVVPSSDDSEFWEYIFGAFALTGVGLLLAGRRLRARKQK